MKTRQHWSSLSRSTTASLQYRRSTLILSWLLVLIMGTTTWVTVNGLTAEVPSAATKPSTLVVYGDQYKYLPLIVSKIAAKRGIKTYCICGTGTEKNCRRLLYGEEYAKLEKVDDDKVHPISSPDDMQVALQAADCMVLVGNEEPLDSKTMSTLVNIASEKDGATKDENFVPLSKIVLLSKMGATKKGGGGFFGGGGGGKDGAILQSETFLQDKAKEKGLDLAIVRAGVVVKGGGPGDADPETGLTHDFGLNRFVYTKFLDVVEATVAMAHDRYTLGADVTAGDKYATESAPNMLQIMGTKSSFEEVPYETNRIVAAEAVVAALYQLYENNQGKPLDFSVSTKKGRAPPTPEEWSELLKNI